MSGIASLRRVAEADNALSAMEMNLVQMTSCSEHGGSLAAAHGKSHRSF